MPTWHPGAHVITRNRPRLLLSPIAIPALFVVISLILGNYYWKPLEGLSIDDSYIFLQYAKNLAERGDLSFNTGDRSLGVTSLAWTLVLAAAHRIFCASPVTEAHLLGAILLGVAASYWTATFRRLGGGWMLSSLIGVALVTDPFLVRHSISGMESALNLTILSVLVFHLSGSLRSRGALTGILIGVAYLTRPDNLVSLPALFVAALIARPTDLKAPFRDHWREWVSLLWGFAIVFLPFSLWSLLRVGSLVPPTRIGKLLVFLPSRYGLTFEQFNSLGMAAHISIALKCFTQGILPMFTTECERTVLPVVLIGVCSLPILSLKRWHHRALCMFLSIYSIGLVLAYALFFPLVKDRHLSNLHSVAIAGTGMLALYFRRQLPPGTVLSTGRLSFASIRSMPVVIGGVLGISFVATLFFLGHYRAGYLKRVANIKVWCLTGTWLSSHAPPQARVALEPMGAIKYCSGMYVLDMGGLATRETWQSISQGQGGALEPIHQLLRAERIDYIVDHHPSEWLGRLADEFRNDYHLVARILPPPQERAFGATDVFDVFATQWGVAGATHEMVGESSH